MRILSAFWTDMRLYSKYCNIALILGICKHTYSRLYNINEGGFSQIIQSFPENSVPSTILMIRLSQLNHQILYHSHLKQFEDFAYHLKALFTDTKIQPYWFLTKIKSNNNRYRPSHILQRQPEISWLCKILNTIIR